MADRDWWSSGPTGSPAGPRLQAGGPGFPVFLHPDTREEYALARTERKTGRGYHGFAFHAAPDVTLEADLARRDLTINAMARAADGTLVDPFGRPRRLRGQGAAPRRPGLRRRPVRILRWPASPLFPRIHRGPETLALMQTMVANGGWTTCVPERVWQELAKGLLEARPARMEVLRQCGALARLLPGWTACSGAPAGRHFIRGRHRGTPLMVVDAAAQRGFALAVRFAPLTHDLGKGSTPADLLPRHHGHEARSVELAGQLCRRLKVPNDCRDLALLAARWHGDIHRGPNCAPPPWSGSSSRPMRCAGPERFEQLLQVCLAISSAASAGRLRPTPSRHASTALWRGPAVDAGAIARQCTEPARLPERIHAARVDAARAALAAE